MILSRGRGYLFIHIPKTGGTSMALALEARAMKNDIMAGDTPKARNRRMRVKDVATRGRLWKHSTLADLDGLVTQEDLSRLFIFTMVRNPWDRLVSYHAWLGEQSFEHPAVSRARGNDFAAFVEHPETQAEFRSHPASRYVRDAGGAERCALYIRLEHLDEDKAPLERHLGFDLSLPHTNASTRERDYRQIYTPRLREIVAEICAEDIHRFGYAF